ncbi:hypothetical protein L1049_016649 [Liquidambar formosana]|uniref:Uncharacterized protein n=1 Tax=Liquidambar formosana TaxID=63359 RepID=A0AAP0S6N4_LIQFO
MFSQAGKEILIKAVAMALPSYVMSSFKLPVGLCNDLNVAKVSLSKVALQVGGKRLRIEHKIMRAGMILEG